VDITKDLAIIWYSDGANRQAQPVSCNQYPAISCKHQDKFCEAVISVALAAKLGNKQVEFNHSGHCNGSFSEVGRFRMMP